jgi:small subunit ribosomal protein S6
MKHYELLCVLRGTLSEDEVLTVIEKVKETITKLGGEILETKDMGKSRIAYPIKHIRYGYFHLIHFDAEPSVAPQVQNKLRLFSELLRSLVSVRSIQSVEQGGEVTIGGVIDEIVPRPKRRDGGRDTRKRKKITVQGASVSEEKKSSDEKDVVTEEKVKDEVKEIKEEVEEKKWRLPSVWKILIKS